MKKKAIIFGAGRNLKHLLKHLHDVEVLYAVDNDQSKWGSEVENLKVYAPQTILETNYDTIIISLTYPRFDIFIQILELGVKKESIEFYVDANEPLEFVNISENGNLICKMKYDYEILEWKSPKDEELSQKIFSHDCMKLLGKGSYLFANGWFNSAREMKPIDFQGECLPWITYPTIDFLSEKDFTNKKIFEYGVGNSTIYWTQRGAKVVGVEHDLNYYELIKSKVKDMTASIYYHELNSGGGGYSKFSRDYMVNYFDMVMIDGRDRVNCCKYAVEALNDEGVILFDDSDREAYNDGYSFLKTNGFKELPFWGMVPELTMKAKTSIFYRKKNWLNI